ncbi:MAG TPA: Ig-like domain-containing protein [Micromonosporaceae bacterium]|nr:Ig-like domain-containing protein [Micromonosporaceae bacterium]
MNRVGRALAGALVLVGATAVLMGVVAGTASGDQPPAWEPEPGVLGSISFFDANGTEVTSGDIGQHPSAFYAAASGPGRDGDTKAQLKAFTPQVGVPPPLWTGDTLTGATDYPNTNAPPNIAAMTVPVAAGTPGDLSLADYISEFPNNLPDPGYTNLYELRLYTSGPGRTQDVLYFRTDIRVTILGQNNGEFTGVWDVVYPPTGGATGSPTATPTGTPTSTPTGPTGTVTNTALAVDPSGSGPIGGSVTLTATVTPAGVAGTVDIRDGRSDLGKADYTASTGTATLTLTPTEGTHVFGAQFRPSDAASFTGSDSVSVAFHVVNSITKVSVTLVTSPSNTVVADASGEGHVLLAAAVLPVGVAGSVHFFAGPSDLGAGTYTPSLGLAVMSVAGPPGPVVFLAEFTPADPTAFTNADSNPPVTLTVTPHTGGPAPTTPPVVTPVPVPTTPAAAPTTAPPTTPPVASPTPTAPPSGQPLPSASVIVVVSTPTDVGGPLSLSSRSTSLTAFIGLWALLAVTAVGALVHILRRNRRYP